MQWQWQQEPTPLAPWTNMERDTRLLTILLTDPSALPTVRIYQWDRPAVSIGRLQKTDRVQRTYPEMPLVRRPTGGRAVLHGEDLTITVVTHMAWLPKNSGQGIRSSHRQIMAGVIDALWHCGIHTAWGNHSRLLSASSGIHCFDQAMECDLVDSRTGQKIVGSAQRREQQAILQQMSLPLDILPDVPTFIERLQSDFEKSLSVEKWKVN
jgi:lipoate-protein ligase A